MPSKANTNQLTADAVCVRAFLAELLGRYSHLNAFVQKCSKEARGRSPNLFAAYSSEIGEANEELVSFAPALYRVSESISQNGDLFAPFDFLFEHSSRFQKNHQALRSFPTPWPDSEVFVFLKLLFGENGLASDFESLQPTIVNSDEFNFLQYDLRRDLLLPTTSSAYAVWALPKSESTNPLLWPVLVHEVAHSLLTLSDEVIKEFHSKIASQRPELHYTTSKDWAIELNADYFAYRLLGPAYILCLIYFSMFFVVRQLREPVSPDGFLTTSHPPPHSRINLLWSEFDRFLANNSFGRNSDLKPTYDKFQDIYDARLSLDKMRLDWPPPNERLDNLLHAAWDSIKIAQHDATPRMPTLCFCKEELETAYRLSRSLNAGEIAASVIGYQSTNSVREWLTRQPSKESKKDMLRLLNERPARMFEILNAGWLAKINNILNVRDVDTSALNVAYDSAIRNGVSTIIKESRALSLRLQKSIQIAVVLSSLSRKTERHRCAGGDSLVKR